ncbi:hypothetical protein OIV54_32115 [Burkholderia pseudomallei]|uniref:hypothetical protein n=1 Tax=Burkholderia pseudomallei TaxID=28450 RepID=UPI0021F6E37D|nr:hypothetical protein [Burkholderia pseudomallei]MCW0098760.1 hypothetical protein [Burkholderia pseudomallei]
MKRPLSLTVLAWFVIVSNVIGLISYPVLWFEPNAVAILGHSRLWLEAVALVDIARSAGFVVSGDRLLNSLP